MDSTFLRESSRRMLNECESVQRRLREIEFLLLLPFFAAFSECFEFLLEVNSIFNVVYLGDKLVFEAVGGVQTFVAATHKHLQVVVSLLNLLNVSLLQTNHLVEPVEHNLSLTFDERVQLVVEIACPKNLRVGQTNVYHLVAVCDAQRREPHLFQVLGAIDCLLQRLFDLDESSKILEKSLNHVRRFALLD